MELPANGGLEDHFQTFLFNVVIFSFHVSFQRRFFLCKDPRLKPFLVIPQWGLLTTPVGTHRETIFQEPPTYPETYPQKRLNAMIQDFPYTLVVSTHIAGYVQKVLDIWNEGILVKRPCITSLGSSKTLTSNKKKKTASNSTSFW